MTVLVHHEYFNKIRSEHSKPHIPGNRRSHKMPRRSNRKPPRPVNQCVELKNVPGMGTGVFAIKKLVGRLYVGKYSGICKTYNEVERMSDQDKAYVIKVRDGLYIDARHESRENTEACVHMINNTCWRPNIEFVCRGREVHALTTREVKKGEELLARYGPNYKFFKPNGQPQTCQCGSARCQDAKK